MTQRMMVRSFLTALVSLSVLAAPAFAAGPAQPADSPRSAWLVELGDLVSRAAGLLLGDWSGERPLSRDDAAPIDEGVQSMTGQDEGNANMDPNG